MGLQYSCYGSLTEPGADQGFAESKTFIQKRESKAREINNTHSRTHGKRVVNQKRVVITYQNTVQSRARQTRKLPKGVDTIISQ